jgi:hypothetical protein
VFALALAGLPLEAAAQLCAGERPIIVQGTGETRVVETSHLGGDWRRDLKVKIAWTLAAKLLGLILLWFLFFQGNHS